MMEPAPFEPIHQEISTFLALPWWAWALGGVAVVGILVVLLILGFAITHPQGLFVDFKPSRKKKP